MSWLSSVLVRLVSLAIDSILPPRDRKCPIGLINFMRALLVMILDKNLSLVTSLATTSSVFLRGLWLHLSGDTAV